MTRLVVVVGQVPPPVHGSNIMAQRLLEALASEGWEPRLVDKRFSRRVDEVGRPSARKLFAAFGLWARLIAALRERPHAAVLFLTDRPGSFLVDAVSTLIIKLLSVPLIHQIHSQGFRALAARGRIWRTLVSLVLGSAQRISCLSPTLGRDLEPFVRLERLRFIPNSVGPARNVDRQILEPPLILFVANLFRSKRAHLVVEVVERLDERGVMVSAQLAGARGEEDYYEELTARIATSSARDRIQLLGGVGAEERDKLFSKCSVLLHPTALDAQPLVILEAMRVGVPVVTTDVGGIADLFPNDALGRVVPQADINEMVSATAEVIRRLAPAGDYERRSYYSHVHGPDAFGKNWSALLNEVR